MSSCHATFVLISFLNFPDGTPQLLITSSSHTYFHQSWIYEKILRNFTFPFLEGCKLSFLSIWSQSKTSTSQKFVKIFRRFVVSEFVKTCDEPNHIWEFASWPPLGCIPRITFSGKNIASYNSTIAICLFCRILASIDLFLLLFLPAEESM